jgi:chromosome segregation ATPase
MSYAASQLYQLAEYTKEQERLQEKQNWTRDLVASQEQLKRANQHRSKLQAECAQLKVSLEKYSKLTEHLKTIVKFENGLGTDIKTLQTDRDKSNNELRKLKSRLQATENEFDSIPGQIAKVTELRVNSLGIIRELQLSITALQGEKSGLEKRLLEASKALAQEKSRQTAFDERLQTFETERKTAEEMLNGCVGKINDHLSEFKTFIEQGTSSSEACRGLLELMKKEGVILFNQVRSAGTNMETMKTSVAALSLG